ncbi:hypothetical protein H4CHR_04421 [Variovorax sp. PBS-H4]|uniref:transcriptional regulator n=1 Tax=Variovorax sp. PBS-H4 TaxID=434008 RepID=UPI0013190625|nr:YdaS family helix-turn-helix protein [Variovorax sp. PBS-H4]VTU38423.1 hypothetical protein H4CHR_04421 [Variovorax sp. PBS-H4]
MRLKSYLDLGGHGSYTRFAAVIGCHGPDLFDWANEKRPVPIHWALKIEKASNRAVMRWDTRPGDWHEFWPEIARWRNAPPIPDALKAA